VEAIRHRNGNPTTAPCACDFHRSIWPVLLSLAALLGQQSLAEQRGPAWPVHVIDSGLSGCDGVRLLDVDDDGDLDLAVGWEQSGVARLYLNPGPIPEVRGKWPVIDCGPAPHVEDTMPADVDGDGRIDVVSCTEGSNRPVLVHFAPREGSYTDSAAWTTVEFPESLAGDRKWMFAIALDVNEDGRLDLVAGGKSPAIRHDILDFCERELVTLSGGGVEKKMAIIVLVNPRWNHLYLSTMNGTTVRLLNSQCLCLDKMDCHSPRTLNPIRSKYFYKMPLISLKWKFTQAQFVRNQYLWCQNGVIHFRI